MIDRYVASDDFTKTSASTQRRYRPILEELKDHCGGALIGDLRERHIRELRKRFASSSTADFATMLLRMLWTFAKEELAIDLGNNPAGEIRKLHRHQEPYEPWPQELIDRFEIRSAAATDRAPCAAIVAVYWPTSERRGSDAMEPLRWRQYPGSSQVKTKAKLTIPCHSRLKAALDAAAREHGPILTTQYSQPYSAHGLSTLVQRATAKLDAKQYTAHGLRCNAAIALAEAGCTVHEIMAITGHKTYKLAMHYSQRAGQKKLARQAIESPGSGKPANQKATIRWLTI